jgi:hypothetical protein
VNPILSEATLRRLRLCRLERLQVSMRSHRVEACLLFNEPNVRYAAGVSAMPIEVDVTHGSIRPHMIGSAAPGDDRRDARLMEIPGDRVHALPRANGPSGDLQLPMDNPLRRMTVAQ